MVVREVGEDEAIDLVLVHPQLQQPQVTNRRRHATQVIQILNERRRGPHWHREELLN